MAGRILVQDGILKNIDAPTAPLFLASTRPGAYTTCRTGGEGSCILLWERHLLRLAQSLSLLAQAKPHLYPVKPRPGSTWDDVIRPLVQSSLEAGLPKALEGRKDGEELSITTLVCGGSSSPKPKKPYDVYVHISSYIPSSNLSGAQLAIVGPGREIASSKFSEWVRTRQSLEKLRPPLVTELLLSNDGDRILEGSITNFFVVCYQETKLHRGVDDFHLSTSSKWFGYEVQTAPITDGVLPGVIRQLVIEMSFFSRGSHVRNNRGRGNWNRGPRRPRFSIHFDGDPQELNHLFQVGFFNWIGQEIIHPRPKRPPFQPQNVPGIPVPPHVSMQPEVSKNDGWQEIVHPTVSRHRGWPNLSLPPPPPPPVNSNAQIAPTHSPVQSSHASKRLKTEAPHVQDKDSLRLVQHVNSIQAPSSWDQTFYTESWEEISWKNLHLEGLGAVTKKIQKLVLERAMSEGYRFMDILR